MSEINTMKEFNDYNKYLREYNSTIRIAGDSQLYIDSAYEKLLKAYEKLPDKHLYRLPKKLNNIMD